MKTTNDIAKKYVHGLHDALTDNQEIIDMSSDIQQYADEYHKAKLKLLNLDFVRQRSELLIAFTDWMDKKGYYLLSFGLRRQMVRRFLKAIYSA